MKDGAPISVPSRERGIHNPFAKGGIARTTLAGFVALTGAQMFDPGCAVRTLAPGDTLPPPRPAATEPSSPSLPDAIANANKQNAEEGKPPVKFNTPMPPVIQTAEAQAAAIGTVRAGTSATQTAEAGVRVSAGGSETKPASGGGETAVKKPEVVTQEQLVAQIDSIIDKIKNPDPALLEKYKVDPRSLTMDQNIIIYGGVPEELTKSTGKGYTVDSLMGMQEKARNGVDPKEIQRFVRLTYDQITKRGLGNGEGGERIMSASEAKQIDPDHIFLFFAADVPNAKPGSQDKASYTGSMVKEQAALATIRLWYMLKWLIV